MGKANRRSSETLDGRALRSERSREAIAAALFELVGEGNLEPTAQQVADRAHVGIRTVFRHFSDMEALYATLDAWLLAEVGPMLRSVMQAGQAAWSRDQRLFVNRNGRFEECYFTWCFSSILDESGVGGVLVTVTETTEHVLGQRRGGDDSRLDVAAPAAGDEVCRAAELTVGKQTHLELPIRQRLHALLEEHDRLRSRVTVRQHVADFHDLPARLFLAAAR